MLNDLDRFSLAIDVIDQVPGLAVRAAGIRQEILDARLRAYTRDHGGRPRDRRLDLARLMRVLTVNAGSSSLKLSLVQDGALLR